MKIAIIGGTGLLGSNLLKLYSEYDVKSFSRKQSYNVDSLKNHTIDFRYLEEELNKYFTLWKPDVIVHTIAIVNLQECEDNFNYAQNINCKIAVNISKIAKKYNSYFIHISTDHYYNDKNQLHSENQKVTLLNNYSKTKFNAEKEISSNNQDALIVRTNIVGFRRRTAKSFFEWLIDSFQKEKKINLYTNFYTSPISVNELGIILLKCYEKNLVGTYNIASSEVINKYEFGLKTAQKFKFKIDKINSCSIDDTHSNIQRALTLGLDVSKIENALNIKMPTIDETLNKLYNEYKEYDEQ